MTKKLTFLTALAMLVMILLTSCGEDTNSSSVDESSPVESIIGEVSAEESLLPEDHTLKTSIAALPGDKAMEYIWDRLEGYWTSESKFVGFIRKDNVLTFEYGLYATSYGFNCDITGAQTTGENKMSLTIHIAARPATEMDDAMPERTETVYFDVSHFEIDGRINIKLESLDNSDEWFTYEHGGHTLEDAFAGLYS